MSKKDPIVKEYIKQYTRTNGKKPRITINKTNISVEDITFTYSEFREAVLELTKRPDFGKVPYISK